MNLLFLFRVSERVIRKKKRDPKERKYLYIVISLEIEYLLQWVRVRKERMQLLFIKH